jgi:prevent-host-death family protein
MEDDMVQMALVDDIRPISDLKSKSGEMITHACETKRPLVLTRHGRPVAVVLAVEEYERMQRLAEQGALVNALKEAEQDIEAGRLLTHEEMRAKWLNQESVER